MRLLLVWIADPHGYPWMPPSRSDDVVVTFDDLAADDLSDRGPIRFDDLQSWADRGQAERLVSLAFRQVRDGAALGGQSLDGYELVDFFEHSLRVELANVHRGWVAGGVATDCTSIVADPVCPPALLIGAHAAAGVEAVDVPYVPAQSPMWQSSFPRRVVGHGLVWGAAAVSPRTAVRLAAAANYKVTPALASVPGAELRSLGVAAMPLPGFDPRENLRCAARARLRVLRTIDPISKRGSPTLHSAGEPEISTGDTRLDAAFSDVATRLAEFSWPQLAQAVRATQGLERQRSLRAILMPTLFSGTPRVFTAWARRRGVKVAVLQHGVYAFRDFNGQDRGADVVLTWGDAVAAQSGAWWDEASTVSVGAPGIAQRGRPPATRARVQRVLIATTGPSLESALSPAAYHDWFASAVLPGAAWLQQRGVSVALRLHPSETPDRYRRIMEHAGTRVPFAASGSFAEAALDNDILVSAFSSVALEASAMGMPVLMFFPPMPDDFRVEHFVRPWTASLPGVFHDSESFLELAEGLLGEQPPSLQVGLELATLLSGYARPFDPSAFSAALEGLVA